MFSCNHNQFIKTAVLASSCILNSSVQGDEPSVTKKSVALATTSLDSSTVQDPPNLDEKIKATLGEEYHTSRAEAYKVLLKSGISFEHVASILPSRLVSYKNALNYTKPEDLTRIIELAARFGQENSHLLPDFWIETLNELSSQDIEALLELQELFIQKKLSFTATHISAFNRLLKYGLSQEQIAGMDTEQALTLDKDLTNGRYPIFLRDALSSRAKYEYSLQLAKADPDLLANIELVRASIVQQLNNREHVSRNSTDYTEGVEQFLAIENPHLIILIKKYIDYFSQTENILAMQQLFPVIQAEDTEEQGGLIIADGMSVKFVHIPQYMQASDRKGNEDNTFKTPELCQFINHLGILHTHPGGPLYAGPSGYTKPAYGPGKYHPVGDTYCLVVANQTNPFTIHVVVSELGIGKLNIDLFLRDVKIGEDGAFVNSDPIRVIDLGVFDARIAALQDSSTNINDINMAKPIESIVDDSSPNSDLLNNVNMSNTPATISVTEQEIDQLISRLANIDTRLEREVTGTELRQKFKHLLGLIDIDEVNKIDFLELLSYGAEPEQIVDVHRYHIHGLVKGFRTGRYPNHFLVELGRNHVEYATRAAVHDPDAKQGSPWAKEYIRAQLQNREHLFRIDTDYDEGLATLDRTMDKYMLFLIKRYVDFFNNQNNWPALINLFRPAHTDLENMELNFDQELPTPERGGLILIRNNQIVFEEILQSQERLADPDIAANGYGCPHIQYYAVALGGLHTHPLDLNLHPKHNGELAAVAGPSGVARTRDAFDRYSSDLGSLRYFNQGNPFAVDVVITQLGNQKYNVDIYYRDVKEIDGKAVNEDDVYVLDLGIFDQSNMEN